jgi:hypothetical protein
MLGWIIQITIISLILIFLVHYLIDYFKSTLTVPKVKDLVNLPTQKYQNIYDTILNKEQGEQDVMKTELKNFLKKQLNDTTEISTLDSYISDINDIKI